MRPYLARCHRQPNYPSFYVANYNINQAYFVDNILKSLDLE